MGVYVDHLQHFTIDQIKPEARRFGRVWCHMWTDGDIEDLHALARKIGLKRAWFQDHPTLPHYDLTPHLRTLALNAGARDGSPRTIIARNLKGNAP